ncbi:ribonuclease HI [Helicobacter cetorum]|uniref:ribonuclease HI n=1 Tax=Helicobacter cetorum TaxID=138563 RepID=UPI000CF08FB2|nr:ribonuclease HI [Helicobacter cetorum]
MKSNLKDIEIFCDGSSLGNPGPGGYAAILRYKDREKVVSGGESLTTNNRMELRALNEALKVLKSPCKITLYSDSQYVCQAINAWLDSWKKRNFAKVKNVDLWKEFLEVSKTHSIIAIWVKGHNGHAENERCDSLAKLEAQKFKK